MTPRNDTYRDLLNLPQPKGKILAAVYSFRDQTGQYKPSPASSFSTAVTQGAASMLMDVLNDSGWFIPLEREGLQNLLTERKIIRAALAKPDVPENNVMLPSLVAANILLEGGIVAYDTNIRTGGAGARYFGIGADEQYRVDQVTVNLRAVDIRSGRVLHSVLTSKTVYSKAISADVFRYVKFKRLLEMEVGTTTNEPAQIATLSAMESAVIHLISEGIVGNSWALQNPEDINNPLIQYYLNEPTTFM
ncbi:CsgG/HfaB family protein [Microbulbifer pacificus]|uniref:Curli production assembly/transport component CsgG n=1 Tax=Microbulbifer pacificus TaxID=407164 RepID=A0AAU0MXX2_9GAMM|nr:CsgG/HfaB family protein [Microbulbifer pacificus]WOX04663.1 CsgG/HfaB family protein [Microbulbifer pacificus]